VVVNQSGRLSSIIQFHHIPSHLAPSFNMIDPRKEDAPAMAMMMTTGSPLPLSLVVGGYGYGRDGS
jgi:hypothetical protein